MAADPIVYCLENLTDYAQFERLCHELMALEGYSSIEPLGGCHDQGRDAIHVNRTDNEVTIFCYSVRNDWLVKLKQDAKVIHRHNHPCDRLAYLSTYEFKPKERDEAIEFIRETYGWELEPFGLERLRTLLTTRHSSLLQTHPQIFHPRFFDSKPESFEDRIRSLMDRLVAANEKHLRCHLRIVLSPYSGVVSPESMANKDRRVAVAIPKSEIPGPIPSEVDLVLSNSALKGCTQIDCWGVAGIRIEGENDNPTRLIFLVWGGPEAENASREFDQLARESGRLYQTLPSFDAPIHGTTSPRNLWAAVLYGRLRGTEWVLKGDGFEFIGLPFASSAELWRRLLRSGSATGIGEPSRTLSDEALRLLLAASTANRQTITVNSDMYGFHLGTGDGPIIDTEDDRTIAECRSWIEELIHEDLIEDRWHKGQVFAVTAKGFSVVDRVKQMA